MNGRDRSHFARGVLALSIFAVTATACSADPGVSEPRETDPGVATKAPAPTTSPVPISEDVPPVSLDDPGTEAEDAFARCNIGDPSEGMPVTYDMVSGMGRLDSAEELGRFVPLTGREPVFLILDPVWVIQIKGDVLQRGGEVWTDPTCIVAPGLSGYYATGPVRNLSTGATLLPEAPAREPDLALPPLAP